MINSNKILIVVFDLDDCFWKGTFNGDESTIEYNKTHHEVLLWLNNKNILLSLASFNELETVRAFLIKKGIWSLFFHPQIGKGRKKSEMLEVILKECKKVIPHMLNKQLLFIEDNFESNIFCKNHFGVSTGFPDLIRLLPWLLSKGDD